MNIDKLIEEKINLLLTLQAMSQCNAYGKNFDDLVEAEKKRIQYAKRLYDVEDMINQHISNSSVSESIFTGQ